MKSDFGMYELHRYIMAEYELRELEADRIQEREMVLCSAFPSLDVSEGKSRYFSSSTELAAIRLVEIDEAHKKAIERLKDKTDTLKRATYTLTEGERHAFNVMTWGDVSEQPADVLESNARVALEKVRHFIIEYTKNTQKDWQIRQKEERIQRVANWKEAQ
ncbi:hypothetical protein EQV77_17980 [Halobacillus fulvus]|nr:hypothetical protein EQV77_17980 [Halobacillus fulvus]